ncbi:uncharacterized protein LOC134834805 [Culicoides brevitarsis]|uniref:uncharacterized protein LOC134834805 n=1 Tax=Culicoides brevitarsis TaxID=469753 RepID=UPI00307C1B23
MSENDKRKPSSRITRSMTKKLKLAELNMTKLMDLDDDCLLHLLRFFDIFELIQLRGICCRLDNLILQSRKRFGIIYLYYYYNQLRFWKEKILEILEFVGPQVKILDFDWIPSDHIEDKSIFFYCIAKHFTILENFKYFSKTNMDDKTIQKFAPIVKRLKSLTIISHQIDDNLSDCFLMSESLEELKFESWNRKITKKFFENISNLKSLTINECWNLTSDCYVEILKNNLKLKKLKIKVNSVDYYNYHPILLKGSHNLVNFIVNNLCEIKNLSFDVLSSNVSLLGDLPNLKILEIHQRSRNESDEPWISRELNNLLEKLTEKNIIEELYITGFNSQINVDLIGKLTSLNKLSLYGTQSLGESDLIKLQTLEELEMLAIENLKKSTSVFCLLEPLKNLEKLDLQDTNVTVDFFKELIPILNRLRNRPKLNLQVNRIHREYRAYQVFKDYKNILHVDYNDDDTFASDPDSDENTDSDDY